MEDELDTIVSYLQSRFADHQVEKDWDRVRDVAVLRLTGGGKTMLLEIPRDRLESEEASRWEPLFDEWKLPEALKRHYRVLVTPGGPEPLPWRQLGLEVNEVEETSRESFPASDSPSYSTISRTDDT